MEKSNLFFCEAISQEAYRIWKGELNPLPESEGLVTCGASCAYNCLILKNGVKTPLELAIAQAEVSELKSRIALRNRQIRDLRRELRKRS